MRLSVSDHNVHIVRARFRPEPGSNVEVVVSPDGLDILANAAGYRTLARWFLVMAHPEWHDDSAPEWFHSATHLDEAFRGQGIRVVYGSDSERKRLEPHDVRLYRSERPGKTWWGPIVSRKVWEAAVRRVVARIGGSLSDYRWGVASRAIGPDGVDSCAGGGEED
jgi:hypothetical protein